MGVAWTAAAPAVAAEPRGDRGVPVAACRHAAECDYWIELDAPPLGAVPPGDTAGAKARIDAQQDRVMSTLKRLGGVELGRVTHVRNAIAVRLPLDAVESARRIPGVASLTPVRDQRHPGPVPRLPRH